MAELLPIPLDEQIAELERELALRARVYPAWIMSGRISRQKADRQTGALEAAIRTLHRLKAEGRS